MKGRGSVLQIILTILGILAVGYYAIIGIYTGSLGGSSIIWPFAGAACWFLGFMLKRGYALPKGVCIAGGVLVSIGLLVFLLLTGLIFSQMGAQPEKGTDYLVVLGAQVRGTVITKSLKLRLDAALKYLKENEETIVIVSGGQGPDEVITEAEAMKQYLLRNGIGEERIIKEDRSTNTNENLLFSRMLIEAQEESPYSVCVVSNNFHVFRAKAIGRKQGFMNIQGLAAKSDPILFTNYVVREVMAIGKDWIIGNL